MDEKIKGDDNSGEVSIEEEIDETISIEISEEGNSNESKCAKLGEIGVRKGQLFDIDDDNPFEIDDDQLFGGKLAQHFKVPEDSQISKNKSDNGTCKKKYKNLSATYDKVEEKHVSLEDQSTTKDLSELADEASTKSNKLFTRSLDIGDESVLSYQPRGCQSLHTAVKYFTLPTTEHCDNSNADKQSTSIEKDHSIEEIVESNQSIEATLDSKDLNSLAPDIDINNESEISKILDGTTEEVHKSILTEEPISTATESGDDVKILRGKISSMDSPSKSTGSLVLQGICHEPIEKQTTSGKQMERISSEYSKEILEDITEESEKCSAVQEIEKFSKELDSIVSLNIIQKYEDKIKSLEEVISSKDAYLASLNMQLEAIQRRESFANTENRDSLKEFPPSGRDSYSFVTTSTEYRTLQDDCMFNKPLDFHNIIVERDIIIKDLKDSLQKSIEVREELQKQSEKLTIDVQYLRKQLTENVEEIKKPMWRDHESTSQRLSQISMDLISESDDELDRCFSMDTEDKITSNRNSKERQLAGPTTNIFHGYEGDIMPPSKQIEQFPKYLDPDELKIFFMVQKKFDDYLSQEIEKVKMKYDVELKMLREHLEMEKNEKDSEINRLRDLLSSIKDGSTELIQLRQELESKHAQEIEHLRTYFEGKCADLEKQYSEEILSQKSQRNSNDISSDISDQEDLQGNNVKAGNSRKRTREELYASPSHREITPVTLSQAKDNIAVNDSSENVTTQEMKPKITAEEMKLFYQEKIHEIKHDYEETIKKLKEKLRRFEARYTEDDFMALLSEQTADDQHWPPELILLREKFTAQSQLEITQLQIKHENEMSRLKVDYEKQLSRKFKRNSTFDLSRDLDQIVNERESLRELSNTFRWLLSELLKCMTIREDDLNNTLLEEIQKWGNYQFNQTEYDNNTEYHNVSEALNASTQSNQSLQITLSKRMKFTSDISGLLSVVEDPRLVKFITQYNSEANSFNLKDCLEKLKVEANYLLALSEELYKKKHQKEEIGEKSDSCEEEDGLKSGINRTQPKVIRASSFNENLLRENKSLAHQSTLSSLPPDLNRIQFGTESVVEDDTSLSTAPAELNFQVRELKNRLKKSENDRHELQRELDATIKKNYELGTELNALREQLEQLDSQKEDYSEGYGLGELKSPQRIRTGKICTSFSQLQEKARNILSTPTKMSENTSFLLQMIEDFCREGDKVVEEGKKSREDLQGQIDAADKQLRAIRQFLDEQATEREIEREEFTKEIENLKNQIREKEKEKNLLESASKDTESMEQKIINLTEQVTELQTKKDKFETELKASIDKIFVLREIITELEAQVQTKSLNEHVLIEKVKELEVYIATQTNSNEAVQQEIEHLKSEIGHGYQEKLAQLEEQLKNSRPNAEKSLILEQIAEQLKDIETTLDQKTRLLESIHQSVASTSCSASIAEDVSVQVQKTTNTINVTPQGSPIHTSPRYHSLSTIEIQQVLDKLTKHSRVEEAAIKRIKDLEMQMFNFRTSYAELQNERDVLQERMSEQLLRISSLQSKLEEQRRRSEELQRQGTSDLNIKIHDLQNEVQNLKETLSARDKQIANLKNHLEQCKTIIDRQEAEIALGIQGDRSAMEKLEAELKAKTEENKKLKDKIKNEMINKLALPDLMETMLADKNEEIDQLREQLESKEKELQGILEINLSQINITSNDNENGKAKTKAESEAILSARTLSDIHSISEYDEPDVVRRAPTQIETSIVLPQNNQTETMESTKQTTGNGTQKRSKDMTFFGSAPPLMSTFDNPHYFQDPTKQKDSTNITATYPLIPRQIHFSEYMESTPKIQEITEQEEINELKLQLSNAQGKIENLKISLENVESEKNEEVERLKVEIINKEMLYNVLQTKKNDLEEKIKDLCNQSQSIQDLKVELERKNIELNQINEDRAKEKLNSEQLESELKIKYSEIEDLKALNNKLAFENDSLLKKLSENVQYGQQIIDLNNQVEFLNKVIKDKDDKLEKHDKNLLNLRQNEKDNIEKITQLEKQIKTLQNANEINSILEQLNSVKAELSEKVVLYEKCLLDIQAYEKNVTKLKDIIKEKDDIINSLRLNSKNLQETVGTIQLAETSSLNELKINLKEERERRLILQQKNTILESELEKLRAQNSDNSKPFSLDEIAEQVEKELNYSAQLDTNILKAIESEEEINSKDDFEKLHQKKLVDQMQTLKNQLEIEKAKSLQIQKLLDEEKKHSQEIQQQDADIIEAMRVRLEEAIEKEQELHKILDQEREKCERLSTQIAVLHRSEARQSALLLKSPPDSPRKSPRTNDFESELTDRLKNEIKLLTAQNEREKERITDLQGILEREKNRFETELSERIEYYDKLKGEMNKLARDKDLAEQEVEHLQERLTLASREIESLESRIATFQEVETRRAQRRDKERVESTQSAVELQEIKAKVMMLEVEKEHFNQTVSMLRSDIERGAQREAKLAEELAKVNGDSSLPQQFLQKMKEINDLLTENTKENHQKTETIQYLIEERKTLQKKLDELESGVRGQNYMELEERANHLFGKYLRVESHRKALVHQKRYLLILLKTYEENEIRALQLMNRHLPTPPKKNLFKSVALAIIAIQRMKFIAKRWQSGKRCVSKSIFNIPIHRKTNNISAPSLSPPCRDTNQLKGFSLVDNRMRPLQSPGLISECSQKFDWSRLKK